MCRRVCQKFGIFNLVGFNYEKISVQDIVEQACVCLVPDGAADCSGFYDTSFAEGDSSYCVDFGKGKGPVAFTFDKEGPIRCHSKEEISNLEVLETRCICNDNFDPNEPPLEPSSHSLPERGPFFF